jgi:uracil-DNA glycosylase family 4
MPPEEKVRKFQEIVEGVSACTRCPLYKSATNGVPGEGSLTARVFFIGEGPGLNEDIQGRPFVGRAGQLLTQSLTKIGWQRPEVFITNVIRHRAPENRDPVPSEIEACDIWTDQILALIQPKVVATLGRFSMAKFLPGITISKAHGQPRLVFYRDQEYLVYPMFHPAAALRAPEVMRQFIEDFQKLPKVADMQFDDLVPPVMPEKGVQKTKAGDDSDQMNLL